MADSVYKPGKLQFAFNPFEETGIKVVKSQRKDALEAVSNYVLEQVLEFVSDGNSPVSGHGKFPGYEKSYKEFKSEISSAGTVNLELFGDMLSALDTKVSGDSVLLTISGEQAEKADGHCKLTGRDNPTLTKERRFIPAADEMFKQNIMSGIKKILGQYDEEKEGLIPVGFALEENITRTGNG